MNLHAIVSGAIGAVNPHVPVSVQASTGYTTEDDGTPTPTYAAPLDMIGQVQPLTYRDLQQVDGLNLNGTKRAIYLTGQIDAIVRNKAKGGDLVTIAPGQPNAGIWLVAIVLEGWEGAGWCKVAVTLQNGS